VFVSFFPDAESSSFPRRCSGPASWESGSPVSGSGDRLDAAWAFLLSRTRWRTNRPSLFRLTRPGPTSTYTVWSRPVAGFMVFLFERNKWQLWSVLGTTLIMCRPISTCRFRCSSMTGTAHFTTSHPEGTDRRRIGVTGDISASTVSLDPDPYIMVLRVCPISSCQPLRLPLAHGDEQLLHGSLASSSERLRARRSVCRKTPCALPRIVEGLGVSFVDARS
jgi:hypothetical protein